MRGRRLWPLALLVVAAGVLLARAWPAEATTLPAGFAETRIAHGISLPTAMAVLPDGRILITEQGGNLRLIKNGSLVTTPVLTVTVDQNGERGLDGIVADPNFATNGWIYVYYTATSPATHNRLSRFTLSGDTAVAGSEVPLIDVDALSTLTGHNGGALRFGTDGKLYLAIGDNQNGPNAQDMTTLKGKVIRINADGSIPTDNPFYGTATGGNRAIWALGFRNPFTIDVQPGTGRIFIDDVGQDSWEEVNNGVAGGNYGWPDTEGYTSDPRYQSPIYAYAHGSDSNTGCAVTGGAFYNPASAQFPSQYVGQYFFTDLCQHWVKTIDPQNHAVADFASSLAPYPIALTVAPDGTLYYLSHLDTDNIGSLYAVRYTGSLAPAIGTQPASQLISSGHSATVSVSASGYAPLSYQWSRNGTAISGATAATYSTPPLTTADSGEQLTVTVTNSFGQATSAAGVMNVTSAQPPAPSIDTPAAATTWVGGQTINYSGSASDPTDGTPPPSAYTWQVDLGHHAPGTPNAHFHPFIPATTGATSGSFVIPNGGETDPDVYYRIILTVTDSVGLKTTISRDLFPITSNVTLASNPSGLLVTIDGQPRTTPATFTGVVGITRTLGVITPQTVNGVVWSFGSWSDAGAATHTISTPATDSTFTATYANARQGTISADPNPIQVCDGTGLGVTNLTWNASGVTWVDVRINSPSGSLFATTGAGSVTRATDKWVQEGFTFYLQDRSGTAPLTAANTLATVTVHVTSAGCPPSGSMSANPNPIQVCSGTTGITTVNWTSVGVSTVEVHVGSPAGSLFASAGPGPQSRTTNNWVGEGTAFYLQNTSGGLPLTAANTLATVVAHTTNAGCPSGSISASPNPIQVCDGTGFGVATVSWTTANVSTVEVHIGSPTGALFATTASGAQSRVTGKWVGEGTSFFLQNRTGGLPLTAANTVGSVVEHISNAGCPAAGSISANPNPIQVCDGSGSGVTTLNWTSRNGVTTVQVRLGSPSGSLFATTGAGNQSATTGKWVFEGQTIYLQNTTGGLPLTSANTLGTVVTHLTLAGCPVTGSISASPNPIQVCNNSGKGVTTVSWTSGGVSNVEVHLNSPTGTLFAATGGGNQSRVTGNWVTEGTTFYLQNTTGGLPLTAANTIATGVVHLTTAGCP